MWLILTSGDRRTQSDQRPRQSSVGPETAGSRYRFPLSERRMTMEYRIAPCSVKAALKQVRTWHRHLPKLQGGLFAARVIAPDGECCAVGIFGNPCQEWQDTGRGYITRIAAVEKLPPVGSHAAPA